MVSEPPRTCGRQNSESATNCTALPIQDLLRNSAVAVVALLRTRRLDWIGCSIAPQIATTSCIVFALCFRSAPSRSAGGPSKSPDLRPLAPCWELPTGLTRFGCVLGPSRNQRNPDPLLLVVKFRCKSISISIQVSPHRIQATYVALLFAGWLSTSPPCSARGLVDRASFSRPRPFDLAGSTRGTSLDNRCCCNPSPRRA